MKTGALYGGSRGRTALAILAICVLPAVYFAGYFPFTKEAIAPGDSFCELALRRLAANYWRDGIVPLWNPLSRCGTPLAADPQSGALYPLNLPYLALSPTAASNLTILLHFSLAGILMFWYLRRAKASGAASLLGAVTFMFSGFLTAHKSHTAMQNAAAWLPLILLCVSEAIRRPRSGFALLGAAAVAMQIFAGGGLLAAVLLVPAFEYARLSPRATMSYPDFTSYSFHPFLVPLLLFPNALGAEAPTVFGNYYWGPWNLSELGAGFCGIAPLALAVVAVTALFRSSRTVRLHAVTALAALLLSFGGYTPLYRLLYRVPVYNLFRCPSRNLLVFCFAVAALAAFGLDALTGRHAGVSAPAVGRAARRVVAGLVCVIAASVAFLALLPSFIAATSFSAEYSALSNLTPRLREILESVNLRSNAFLFPLTVMAATAFLLPALGACRRLLPLLFALVFVDLMSFGSLHGANPPRADGCLGEGGRHTGIDELVTRGACSGEFRVCPFIPEPSSPGNSLATVLNLFHGIPSSGGYGPLCVGRYATLADSDLMGHTPDRFAANLALVSMLNLRYFLCAAALGPRLEAYPGPGGRSPYRKVWEGGGQAIYENPFCLPRAWLVAKVRGAKDFTEARAILSDPSAGFDVWREAIVNSADPLPPLGPERGEVDSLRTAPNRITLTYTAPSPNLLVLSEIFYPGWRALIDGTQAAIFPANGILRGIWAPPGSHAVEVSYEPGSFRLGLGCSAAAGLALLIGIPWACRAGRGRRSAEAPREAADGR